MSDEQSSELRRTVESDSVLSLEDIPLHSTNLLSLLDEQGVIRYQSPSIERILGFSQDDLVGVSCTECFHPDDRETVYDAFQTVVSSDQFVIEAVEYRHLKGDGTYLWVESIASSNPTPDGHYVINTRDISERKQQQKELERANERLKGFANVVSHDLRNPLGVAQGYLELAEEAAPTEHHATISDALDRMETLIESLLTNARDETRPVTVEPVNLESLSETCWQNVVNRGATLHTDIDRPIQGDPLHLAQLLENLFRNAIDHGSDDVVVSVGETRDGFYVEDDGAGIPDAERSRIFEAGYTTSEAGTGLGLAIVQQIVDAHGWKIRAVESATGGTRFEITGVQRAE